MSWQQYAACADQDPELFFPIGTSGSKQYKLQEAKRVCAGCAVQSVCLEWAVLADIPYGVWGGVSELERRAVRRPARHQRAQTWA